MSDKKIINCNDINPVDYYNREGIDDVFEKILNLKNIHRTGIDSFTYITNKSDKNKRMVIIENDCFVAKMKNGLNMEIEKNYTAFMMLQKFIFKDSFLPCLNHVIYDFMNHENKYIRIGVKFFKKITKIDRYKIKRDELKAWDRTTIIDDYGKDYLYSIEKYDDFTIEPNNKNYSRIINNNYNVYSPFSHCPKTYEKEEQIEWTLKFLKHLFGEQYQHGITYLKVLYEHPKQTLPILVLISRERQTGKSTFIDWITMLFGANTVIINPENIKSQFNGSYSDKNIIMIEESHFDSRQATEKLKNLSTQKKILVNTKHIPEYSIPFYGKIIITSNDEDKFSKVDDPEIRYWVRKIPTLKGKANHRILEDMVKEIPYFLGYLETFPDVDLLKSRMVFNEVELKTEALERVKLESRAELHKEIELKLEDFCMQNTDIEFFYFTGLDFKNKFFSKNQNTTSSYIQKILRSNMNLKNPKKAKRYISFETKENKHDDKKVGKPFEYKNPYYLLEFEEEAEDKNDSDLPF